MKKTGKLIAIQYTTWDTTQIQTQGSSERRRIQFWMKQPLIRSRKRS